YLVENRSDHLFSFQTTVPEEVRRKLKWAVHQLSDVQRKIIYGLFFHEQHQTEIAKKLGLSQSAVNQAKKLSLNKIKQLIESDLIVAAYLIGGSKNLTPKERSRDEQILEVYLEDLKGSYIK
ncbi:MAG: sigma factor-like helix-turn-helix DNA-binding protein, partial [Bdellovibrionales bacterium]